jgi:GNAT superfamily N-acetyltransferase
LRAEPTSDLVDFYRNDAAFYEDQKLSRTYDVECDGQWCGFFSIANYSLKLDRQGKGVKEIQERKGIPRVPPAILLAQLLVCTADQGKGIGKKVLRHIVQMGLRSVAGCRLIVVDLDNEGVRTFYEKHGWISGPQTSGKMFLDLLLFQRVRKLLYKTQPSLPTEEELQEFAKVQKNLPRQMSI